MVGSMVILDCLLFNVYTTKIKGVSFQRYKDCSERNAVHVHTTTCDDVLGE